METGARTKGCKVTHSGDKLIVFVDERANAKQGDMLDRPKDIKKP